MQNVLEELDSEREWYYDWRQGHLYFAFNGTQPTSEEWVATRTKVLFNVSGTATAPAKGITIKGIQIRDTALTWLDPHGLPSGNDLSIHSLSIAEIYSSLNWLLLLHTLRVFCRF